MKRLLTILFAAAVLPLAAQNYGQDRTIKIWDNSSAPHSNEITVPQGGDQNVLTLTTQTVLYIFEADPDKATGQAIVVCPGGGYGAVCIEAEGRRVAEWLTSQGITCGVLQYRLPNGHKEVPLEDAVEALRTMRRNASELKIDPAKVGIMGFSAGGHLAAYASNFAPDADKPAFSVLIYPVITSEEGQCHKGSFDNLLGADATEYQRAEYSLETRVTSTTPPAIIFVSDGDTLVPPVSSTRYYNALKKAGIKASLHVYPEGYHGWSMNADFPYREMWQSSLVDWLAILNK